MYKELLEAQEHRTKNQQKVEEENVKDSSQNMMCKNLLSILLKVQKH